MRERLPCEFAPTRKKQKRSDGTARPVQASAPESLSRNGNTMSPSIPATLSPRVTSNGNGFPRQTWSPHSSKPSVTSQPPDSYLRVKPGDALKSSEFQLHNPVAAVALNGPMSSTQDNIMLLVDAAQAFSENATPDYKESPLSDRVGRKRTLSSMGHGGPDMPSDVGKSPEEQAEKQAGFDAWSKMRFVRNGWFTAWEAMQYVEYFYERLSPMTPVVFPDYRSPMKHYSLLLNEPILALAILAISSRHMRLSGHAGLSRSYLVHDKLWNNLRRQIERLLWAQEQFGGGFCGGGMGTGLRESASGQLTWEGSLRTLGTIEALLVLTDWQPRALHFPPSDDGNGLLDRSLVPTLEEEKSYARMGDVKPGRDYDIAPYANWLEPAWRSDRMSWMLLGLAQNLAFELGVFDTNHYNCRHQHGPDSECARKRRIRHLVLIYVAQTSGRMGIQSSLNVEDWENDSIWDQTSRTQRYGSPEDPVDIMQGCWIHVARLMNRANREIFSSHQFTRELTASGRYKDSIDQFQPLLQNWLNVFKKAKEHIHPLMQHILMMEYQYGRLYLNSLGLQKVVETWVEGGSNMKKSSLAKVAEENKVYIDEVTDAALTILREITDGISPKGFLRDAPTRTFLRSLSAIMFVLKVCDGSFSLQ